MLKKTILIYVFLCVLSLSVVFGAPLSPEASGYNSQTYAENYNTMVAGSLGSQFNTSFLFSNGTHTLITVPEYTSSTQQDLTTLQTTYNTSPVNFSHHEIRSDAFSEFCYIIAMSNQSKYMDACYNSIVAMASGTYGLLPVWVNLRDGNKIIPAVGNNDTATDGTARLIIALYLASINPDFTEANRTKYKTYADLLAADSYQYEILQVADTTTSYGRINYVNMGGSVCKAAGLGCSTHNWVGYNADVIYSFHLAANFTGNATYDTVARNLTAVHLQIVLQNDTDGDGFGTAPFNYNYAGVGGTLIHTNGGGVNSYHYNPSNPQHDDSDAPRWHSTGLLLYAVNQTGNLDGVYLNLSEFMLKWHTSNTFTGTTSCLQYRYNGSCSTSIRTGYYENGYGALLHLARNQSTLDDKINETLSHFSFSTYTYDSSTGGNALTYRGVRPLKALGHSIGLADIPLNSNPVIASVSSSLDKSSADVCISAYEGYGSSSGLFVIGVIAVIFFVIIGVLGVSQTNQNSVIPTSENSSILITTIIGFIIALMSFLLIGIMSGSVALFC